ncbi:MAG: TetR/AcrR family transcriptional regulator [Deltaproteobacteria bacterium]|nr:TetR/AcrR family transcriptional regulator [Deltaproteobacteria bacterium]MBW2140569.1 TetR/AcrR family transcriptional regulator [Deltaproteobacteria bacterium]
MSGKSKTKDRKNGSAEERILAAALNEFADKGFFGARTQAIADAAGLNKAMLHYYFRSKDNLYQTVLQNVLTLVFSQLKDIILHGSSIENRLNLIVDLYMDIFSRNPKFIYLILRELVDGGERLEKVLIGFNEMGLTPFKLLSSAAEDIEMNREEVLHLFISIVSMSLFPLIIDPFLAVLQNYDSRQIKAFRNERRAVIKAMLKAYLKEE